MGPFIAKIALFFVVGVIFFETINEFNKLFNLTLSPYVAVAPTLFLFVCHEYLARNRAIGKNASIFGKGEGPGKDAFFRVAAWLVLVFCFIFVAIFWMGAIYKQVIEYK